MHLSERIPRGTDEPVHPVVTRDLLARASRAPNGEVQALRLRALLLNLSLVVEVADRLTLTADERVRTEHAALDGLLQAVRCFDPYDDTDFAAFAVPLIERQIRTELRGFSRRTSRPTRR
jgi:DNA-directed RNA polymerase specialized sigma subunit